MNTTNEIKLYGFGVVGQGFQSYLANNENPERLHTIIVKDDTKKRKKVPSIIETTNENTIRDKDTDVILELISSSEEAYGIVAENLEIGKKVISANKKLIAENLAEFIELEKKYKGTFLYEGAVCGSIPIIRTLNDLFENEPITSISGIFNGSSNYILSKIFNENLSYEEALAQAQHLGFAEADPTSDVGGFDALYKLIIITAHGFGKVLQPKQVLNIGIEGISTDDVEFAKSYGLKIKLIAKVTTSGNKINLSVIPTLVNSKSELFNVENEYNAVEVKGKNLGTHFYKGKGAGSYPTGAVVYSDLKAIDKNYKYAYKKLQNNDFVYENDQKITVILGLKNSIDIKAVEDSFSSLYPLDIYGKRFIAQIGLRTLQNIKYELQSNAISLLALQDDELIEELTQSSQREEVLI